MSTPAACALMSRPGIDRCVEQRELARHALDVLAVAQLEQAVGDRRPVAEQLVVRRNLEIEGLRRRHVAVAAAAAATGSAHDVLDVDHRVGERVELGLELVVGLVGVRGRRDRRGLRAEDLRGDHVEQRRLAQRLARVGGEQVVGPGDQVVEIRHDRALHVGDRPLVGEQERIERILAPALRPRRWRSGRRGSPRPADC